MARFRNDIWKIAEIVNSTNHARAEKKGMKTAHQSVIRLANVKITSQIIRDLK